MNPENARPCGGVVHESNGLTDDQEDIAAFTVRF